MTVMSGEIIGYIVDIRPESLTFGQWERVSLSSDVGNSVLLEPTLRHAFQCVSD